MPPDTPNDPEQSFEAVVERLLREPDTDTGRAFHQPGVRVKGKIVAMLVDDELVVKLPAERCAELVAAGAQPFRTGKRAMREWVSIPHEAGMDWTATAEEALAFVRRGTR